MPRGFWGAPGFQGLRRVLGLDFEEFELPSLKLPR